MKIYSIWREGGGRGRGSSLLAFFLFFPTAVRSGELPHPSPAAERGDGHIHRGLKDGTKDPHGGRCSEARAAFLQLLREATAEDETPPSCVSARLLHPPLQSSASLGTAGGSSSVGVLPPGRAHHPSTVPIALATRWLSDAAAWTREQRPHLAAVIFQSNSISSEQ